MVWLPGEFLSRTGLDPHNGGVNLSVLLRNKKVCTGWFGLQGWIYRVVRTGLLVEALCLEYSSIARVDKWITWVVCLLCDSRESLGSCHLEDSFLDSSASGSMILLTLVGSTHGCWVYFVWITGGRLILNWQALLLKSLVCHLAWGLEFPGHENCSFAPDVRRTVVTGLVFSLLAWLLSSAFHCLLHLKLLQCTCCWGCRSVGLWSCEVGWEAGEVGFLWVIPYQEYRGQFGTSYTCWLFMSGQIEFGNLSRGWTWWMDFH